MSKHNAEIDTQSEKIPQEKKLTKHEKHMINVKKRERLSDKEQERLRTIGYKYGYLMHDIDKLYPHIYKNVIKKDQTTEPLDWERYFATHPKLDQSPLSSDHIAFMINVDIVGEQTRYYLEQTKHLNPPIDSTYEHVIFSQNDIKKLRDNLQQAELSKNSQPEDKINDIPYYNKLLSSILHSSRVINGQARIINAEREKKRIQNESPVLQNNQFGEDDPFDQPTKDEIYTLTTSLSRMMKSHPSQDSVENNPYQPTANPNRDVLLQVLENSVKNNQYQPREEAHDVVWHLLKDSVKNNQYQPREKAHDNPANNIGTVVDNPTTQSTSTKWRKTGHGIYEKRQ